ncbi:MAG: SpoIIE family protein phosphatase [Planctomycetes bacterium]|jgi:sigma-B regulation protein RsbU (phosphoserine phosphatase)|nr:SpoIIE family protein phosphatase [Planctomycetota bacterium]
MREEQDFRRRRVQRTGRTSSQRRKKLARNIEVDPVDPASTTILENMKQIGNTKFVSTKFRPKYTVTIKLTLMLIVVSSLLCLMSEYMVYSHTIESLLEEVDRKGAILVQSMTKLATEYVKDCLHIQESEEDYTKKNEQLQEIHTRYTNYLNEMKSYPMHASPMTEIVSIAFVTEDNKIIDLCTNSSSTDGLNTGKYEIKGSEETLTLNIDGNLYETNMQVIYGHISNSERFEKIQAYKIKVKIESETVQIIVMLSPKDITASTTALFHKIAFTTILAILLVICISMILAKQFTAPIAQLLHDINVVSSGDLSHVTKPISRDEIGLLADTFNILTQNLKNAHESELEYQAQEYDLMTAREIQKNLLPKLIPIIPGYDIGSYYQPAKEVGGDYYDIIPIDDFHVGFIVADVSGKSVPGCVIMAMTRAFFRTESKFHLSPKTALIKINEILSDDITAGLFVTAIYCILDVRDHSITICSAGHNPAYVWRAHRQMYELINLKGMALGLDKGRFFTRAIKEEKIILNPGDKFVIYTDGVPEAMNPLDEEYTEDKFYALMSQVSQQTKATSQQLIDYVIKSLEQWRSTALQSDDITMVTLTRNS